jgi:hypothetical protein
MKKRSDSQVLRELAEDYLHLAADSDGKVDALRKRNYQWLVRFSERVKIAVKPRKMLR